MNTIVVYLIEVAITATICMGAIAYLRPSLRRILIELCGTEERADFWLVFSTIFMVGWPLVLGMGYIPEAKIAEMLFFDVANQIKSNLMSFLIAWFGIGCVISFFALIAPRPARSVEPTTKPYLQSKPDVVPGTTK
jgi:hypothetical protein